MKYLPELGQIGLATEQAQIYSLLLERGFMKAVSLSSSTGIGRSMVYKTLLQLEEMGLVEKKERPGAITLFKACHPQHLEGLIDKKGEELAHAQQTLSTIKGALSSQFNLLAGKPNVQFFEGKEGMRKVLQDSLTSTTEIYTYADLEAIYKYIPDVNAEYSSKREKLGIQKKGLVRDSAFARETIREYHTTVTETKFIILPIAEIDTIMQIYDNKISYLTLSEDSMIGVIIEDRSIYTLHKNIFEYVWGITPDLG